MGFEPTTFCLASRRSTTELRPLDEASKTLEIKYQKKLNTVNKMPI
jgi:hypothetical protein